MEELYLRLPKLVLGGPRCFSQQPFVSNGDDCWDPPGDGIKAC